MTRHVRSEPWVARLSLVATVAICSAPAATWAAGGGPDSYGYKWSDTAAPLNADAPTYAWVPITGTALTLTDDQLSAAIALPFTFTFYGTAYTQLYVSSNGFISFTGDTNGCCSGVDPPSTGIPNGWVAFHWNDMYPPAAGGTVKYTTGGTAPSRYFVVEFTSVSHCCTSNNQPATVQAWIYEGSNEIVLQINTATSDGSKTTIGLENAAGTTGLLYASSITAGTFISARAVRFYRSPATQLAFVTAPQSTVAGGCSGITTVEARDASNLTATVATATAIALSSTSSGNTFYSDASCSTAVTSVTLAAGGSSTSFYYRDTTSGSPTLTASATGLGSTTQQQTVTTTALVFTTAPQTVLYGACSGIVTVQNRNGAGTPVNVASATTVALTSTSGTLGFYSDSGCTSAISSVVLPAGGNTASFYFKDPSFGSPVLTVTATGLGPGSQTESITSPAPSEFPWQTNQYGTLSTDIGYDYTMGYGFTPLSSGRVTRLCGFYSGTKTVYLFDRASRVQLASAQVTSANAWSCAPIAPVVVTAGTTYSVAVYLGGSGGSYRSLTPALPQTYGTVRIDGSCYYSAGVSEPCAYSGLVTTTMYGQADIGFLPDPPTRLAITSAAQAVVAGGCSAPVTVQSQNAFGVAPVPAATSVALSSSAGTTTFYAAGDTTCATPVGSVTLAAASSTVQFRFKDTAVGTPTLTATAAGLTAATQTQTIAATRLQFTNAPLTVTAGLCSGALTVQNQSSGGAAVNVASATAIALTTTSPQGTFYSNATCTTQASSVTMAAGTSAVTFYFKDLSPGGPTLTASAAATVPATQTQTVTPCGTLETPVITNATGTVTTALAINTAGYHFTANKPLTVDALCGYWSGAKTLSLLAASTSAVLGTTTVTSANAWSCASITPLRLDQGQSYVVFADLAGSGGAERDLGSQPARALPKTWGNITVNYACSGPAGYANPCTWSTNTRYMDGLVDVRFAPDAVTGLSISSAALTIPTSTCSGPVTLETRGCNGSLQRPSVATGVTLTSSAGTTQFFADADTTCATPITSVTVAVNGSSVRFRFRDSTIGTPTVTAASTGLTSGTQTETIVAAAASRVAFASASQTVAAGACSSAATVQSQDAAGNPSNVTSATTVSLSTSAAATGRFYSDSSCTTQVTSVGISAGTSSAVVYFRDTLAGMPTFTASASGLSSGTQVNTISPATASRLLFAGAAQSVTAGGCSALATVQTQDAYGNVAPVGAATAVTLSSSSGGGTFYSDSTCTAAVSGLSLPAGASSGGFYFKDTQAGAPLLTASAAGFTSGTQTEAITAGPAAVIAFANAPLSFGAGSCSGALTLQSRDAYGNPSAVGAATAATLASSSGGGTFYLTSACGSATASITIGAGTSSVTFYYGDTAAGTPLLTATSSTLGSATQSATVTAGAASRLRFASSSQTLPAGACSAVATAQVQDAFGNPVTVGAATVVGLATTSTGGTFYSNATCTMAVTSTTVAAGSSSAGFYFSDTRTGTPTLTLSNGSLASGTQVEQIDPAVAAQLQFTTAAQSLVAGACSAIATVQSRDAFGNVSPVAAATAVTLSLTGGGGSFYSDASCSTAVASTTLAASQSSASFYFKDTVSGMHTLTAGAAGLTSATQGDTIAAAAPNRLAFTSAAQTVAAGACSGAVTVTAQDVYANASAVTAATPVNLSSSAGATNTFYSNSTCTAAVTSLTLALGTSTVTLWFKDTRTGTPTHTASATGLTSGTQVQTVNAAAPTVLAFTTAAQTLTAGSCSAVATVQSRDAFANPANVASTTTVTLSSSSAGGTFYSDAACTTAVASVAIPLNGNSASFYFKDTTAGTPTLTAAAAGFSSATQGQVINAPASLQLVFVTTAQTLAAGACSALTTVQSQTGGAASNVTSATTVTLSSTSGAGRFYSDSTCATQVGSVVIAAGTSTASLYFRDTVAGSPTLTAAASGFTSGNQGETITPAAAAALAFASAPQVVAAGGCSSAATVQTRDAFGNVSNVAAATTVTLSSTSAGATFYSNSTCTTVASSFSIAAGSSSGSFFFKDTLAGTPTLTAASAGLTSGTQGQTVNAGSPAKVAFTSAPKTQLAGACSTAATVQTQDTFNNPSNVAAATAISLSTSSTGGTFYSDAACTTAIASVTVGAGGNTATFYFKDTRSGSPVLTAASTGLTSGTQTQTINPAAPVKLVFTSGAQSLVAGTCSAAATTQTQDTYNNLSQVTATTTLNYSAAPATVTFYSDATCTTVVTSQTMAIGTANRTFYFKSTTSGAPVITVAATGFTSGTQTETITAATASQLAFTTAAQTVVAGGCSALTSVQSRDSFGNASNVSAATAVTLSDSSGAGTFYSNSTCTTAVASVTIAAGANTASFYWKDTRAGASTLTAAAAGLTSGTQGETITAASVVKLAVITAPQSVIAGACSLVATVQSQDTYSNPSNVGAATSVALTTTSSGGTFYSNSGCTTAVTAVTLAAATNSIGFWFKDTVAGTPTLTATATGLSPATQAQTITAGSASRLAFSSAAQSLTAGNCSAAATVQSRDAFNNVSPVGVATPVTLSTSSSGGTFWSDSGCTVAITQVTIAAATTTASFYFRDTVAGGPTLTAAATGFTSGTQAQTITAAAPARVVYLTAPVTVTAGSCSATALTVQSQDTFGNPSNVGAATAVNLSSSSGTTVFAAASGCGTAVSQVTLAAGTSSIGFWFKDTAAGSPSLTATAVGLTAATQTQTVSAGSATALAYTTSAQTLTAGACSAAANVQRRDAFGNPTTTGGSLVVTFSSTAGSTRFYSDAACATVVTQATIASGAAAVDFYFSDATAGTPIVTASATGLTSTNQGQTIVAGAPARLAFSSAAQTLVAGACSAVTTVQSRDVNNNPSNVGTATSVSLSTTSSGGTFYSDAACATATASVTIAAGGNTATLYFKDTQAGAPTLTGAAAGFTSATQVETIGAAAPALLAFSSSPQTVVAGACSGALTVQSRDTYSNPSNVTSATTVSLTSTSSGATFYSNSTCTTVATSMTIGAGTGSATAWFVDTRAGSPTLTAAAAGLTSGTQTQTINAAAPASLAFITAAQTLSAGACSAVATTQTRDAYSNPSPATAARTVTLTSTSAGNGFFSDAACTTAVTSITVAVGASTASFYFKDTNAGTPTLTAASAGLTSATQVETVNPAAASRLVFTSAAQTLSAGACSGAATVQSQDGVGNPSNVGTATAVALTSNSSGGAFYSNSTCTTAVSAVTIAAGTSSATFWFKDTLAGAPTLTAAATGFTSGAQTQTINAATATRLVFITSGQTLTAGACSALVTVQSQDAFANPSNVTASTAVGLSSTSSGGTFYSDAACSSAIAGVTIAAGTRTAGLYFKDTRSGAPTLTGAAAGFSSATQVETINPAAPSKLVFVTAAQTLSAGACSAAAMLQSQDVFGNASPVGAATAVSLSSTSSGATFYSAAGCTGPIAGLTLAAGTSSATFYFKDTRAGTPTLTGAATGLTSATQVETVNAASPSRLAFLTASQTLTAGACSAAVTVQSQDAFANPSSVGSSTVVTFTSTSTGAGFYSDSGCTAAVTGATIAAGSSTASLYFKDTRAGSPTVTASASGLTSATQSQTLNAAAPSRFAFTNAPLTLAAGTCSAALAIEAQDTYGNPSPVSATTTVTLSTTSSAGTFYQTGTCGTALGSVTVAAGSTSATFFYGDTRAGTPTLTASAAGFTSGTQSATVTSASATRLVITSAAQTLTAGVCSAALTAQAQDAFSNPAAVTSATTVSLTTSSSGGTFAAAAGCGTTVTSVTLAAGSASVSFYYRDTRAGSPTVTASAAGLTSGSQVQTVNAAAPARLVFLTAAQTLTANACSALATVQTQDAFANPSNVTAATAVSLSTSSSGGTFYSDATCSAAVSATTVAAGGNTAGFWFKDTRSGSPTLTAASGTLTSATQVQTINPGAPSRLAFVSAAQTVVAGACSAAATVQSQDGFGNPSPVASATSVALSTSSSGGTFFSDSACTVAVASANIPAAGTTATFWFKDTRSGTPTLTAAAAGLTAATQLQTVNPASAARLSYLTAAQTLTAGACSAGLTVQVQDAFGNAAPGASSRAVALATSSGAGTFYSDAGCSAVISGVTVAAGASAAGFWYRDTLAGAPALTASATGLTSAVQTQSVGAASPSKLVFATPPQTLTAGGCSAGAVLQTRDTFDNTAPVTAATSVALSTTSAGGAFYSDAACSIAAASVTIAASQSTATFYFRDTRAGSPTLTAASGGLTPATQVQTINPAAATKLAFTSAAQSLTAGACSALATLQTQDAFNNPSNLAAAATVTLSTSSAAGAFYSDASCTALVGSVSIAAGAGAAGFYFKDTRAGTPTLTASASGLTSASQVETIGAASPSRLNYTTLAQSVTAGTCSAVARAQSQDGFGNPSSVSAATVLNLSSGSGTLRFFSDVTCGTQVTSAAIAAGTDTASFWFLDTTAGTPTLTAAASGLASAAQVETVNPAAAARLVFFTPSRTVTAGACSPIVTVQSQDNLGNASMVMAATVVNLTTTSGGGTFYSDAACTTAASTVTIAAGQSSASAYFKDTVAGAPTLSASAGGFASGTQAETVTAAAPARLVFVGAPQSLTANACSAATTLRTVDAYGNTSNVSSATAVTLATTSSGGTFYSDSTCATAATGATIAMGASTATFWFKDTRAGTPTLTLSSGTLTAATQVETISAAPPSVLAFTSAAQTVVAGACSLVASLQTRDAFGNPSSVTAATSVSLSSSAATGTFYSDASCTTAIAAATVAAGASTAGFYFKDTRAGGPTLTASAPGFSSTTQGATITAAAAVKLVVTSAPQSLVAGVCSAAVVLESQDPYNNPSSSASARTVTLTTTSSGGTFASGAGCGAVVTTVTLAAGATSLSFFFKDTVTGTPTLTAATSGLTSATQAQTITPAAASQLSFTTAAQTVTAGACSAAASLRTLDSFNNVAPVTAATLVSLTSNSPGGTFYSDAACGTAVSTITVPAGASSGTFYFKDTQSGGPTLTASATGFTSATQVETVNPAATARLGFVTATQTVIAGNCSAVSTVQSQDAFGNAVTQAAARTVTLTTSSPGGTFYSNSTCTTAVSSITIAAGGTNASFYFKDTRSGAPVLTAAATGLTSGTQGQTVSPAAPSRLVITSAAQTVTAGVCSAAVAVQVQDAFANPSPVTAGTTVTLSSTSGTGTFAAAAGCGAAVTSVSIASGSSSVSFYFKDNTAGTPTLTAAAAGLTSATQGEAVQAGLATVVAFSTAPQTLVAGACSASTGIETRDALGNRSTVTAATTVNLTTTSSGGGFFSDSTCLSAITSVTVASGTSSRTFFFKDTRAGAATLTGAATGFTSGTQAATINAAPATVLAFTSAAQTLTAGTCSAAASLQTRDAFGNTSAVTTATTVNLGSSSGGATFYADATCTTVATSRPIAAGASAASFWFRDNTAGTPTLTASAAGLTSATQAQTINPASATRLAFTTPTQTVVAGACSAITTVRTQDGFGNASNVTAALTVALTTSSPGGTFYSNSTCTTAVTSAAVAAGASTASFYFKDTRAGMSTLTAAATGFVSGAQGETITPAAPARLGFATPPQTLAAGACSAVLTVQSQDGFGNASSVGSSILVTLVTSSSAGSFYADPSCNSPVAAVTIVVGGSTASFYYQDTRSGGPTATASSPGLTAGTQVETINPAAPARLAFTTAPQTVAAGACSALATLQVQDAFGNPSGLSAASSVVLSSSSATGTFSSAAGCGTAVSSVPLAAGQTSVNVYFKDSTAGAPTLTATVNGLSSATQGETVNAAPPSALVFVTAAQTLNAGACSAVMTVRARDASGNTSPVGAATMVGLSASSPTGAFFSDPGCASPASSQTMAAGTSQVSFYFRDPTVGSPTLTASATGLTAATQTATINVAGGAARLSFVTPAQNVVAGACSAAATVQSQDSFGNAVPVSAATTVALSSSSGTGGFFSNSTCSAPVTSVSIAMNANAATFYFRDTRTGTPTLTAAASGLSNGTQVETVRAGAPFRLTFVTPAQSLTAGDCSALIAVQTQDSFGNASNVAAVTPVTFSSSSPGGGFFSDAACATAAGGVAIASGASSTTLYYRDNRSGSATLTAAASGLQSGTQVETIVAGPQSALVFTTPAQTVTAGGCSALATVQLRDSLGNPSPVSAPTQVALSTTSASGTFYSDPTCLTAVTSRTLAAGASATSFYFQDDQVGSPTLTASTAGITSATQTQTVIAGAASALAISSAPFTVVAGACSGAITVQAQDSLGNAAQVTSATSVVPSSSAASGAFYSDPACASPAASVQVAAGGSEAQLYYRDTAAGMPTVTASNPGLLSASQVETVAPAAPSRLAFVTAPQSLTAAGCSAVATVETRDQFANPSGVLAATMIALSSSSATGAFFSDPGCVTALGALAFAAGDRRGSFYFKDPRAGTATLTASGPGLAAATQTATFGAGAAVALAFATPPRTVGAGACSAAVTLEARDAQGNAAAVSAATDLALSSSAASTGIFSDAACATAVTRVTVASGGTSGSFYFRDSRLGTPTLTATSAMLGSASQAQTVTTGQPVKLAFGAPAPIAVAGVCSSPVTVETRDAFDNASVVASALPITLSSSSGTAAWFSDAACATALSGAAIAAGSSAAVVYFKDPAAGRPTLTARAAGFTDGTQLAVVSAAAAARLMFVTAPQTLPTGVCSAAATLEVRDALDNPAPVSGMLRVSLASTSTGGTFFADAACSAPIAAFNFPNGSARADFWFRDALPGTPRLTALSAGLTSATQTQTIVMPAPATKVAFASAPLTLEAGRCSPAIQLQTQDAAGAPAPLSVPTDVMLTLGSTVAALYSDAACSTRTTRATIAASDYRATVYLMDAIVEPVVVNAVIAGLTSASQTETIVCPATVDGAFCDDADLCNGRETCRGGTCSAGSSLSCDDGDGCTTDTCGAATGCSNVVGSTCCSSPGIVKNANPAAAVGVPYRYSPTGRPVLSKGTGPIAWAACASGPAGLHVDATTGTVDWVPGSAGPASVCLQATGACGSDMYTFTVDVAAMPGVPPTAVITLATTSVAGTSTTASGTLSLPNPAYSYEWSFGDGTPLQYGAQTSHTWLRAGGYPVRLTVYDASGQVAQAMTPITITDPACSAPPSVRIVADATHGEGSLTAALSADYQGTDPTPIYRWVFGDGTTGTGAQLTHTFSPGAYQVELSVVTADGCSAVDSMSFRVAAGTNLPPHCAVVVSPGAGAAPLPVTFTGTFGDEDGTVSSATWLFSDGVTADAMRFGAVSSRVIDRAGTLGATLEVVDDHGVTCRATATAEASNGQQVFLPQIVSVPTLTAQCEAAYVYGADGRARATGSRPLTWSLGRGTTGKPEGMEIDADGAITWTPAVGTEKTRVERVTLVAQNAAGSVEQDFLVQVECPQAKGKACGCSSSPLGVLALVALAWVRKRRPTTRP